MMFFKNVIRYDDDVVLGQSNGEACWTGGFCLLSNICLDSMSSVGLVRCSMNFDVVPVRSVSFRRVRWLSSNM